MPTVFSKGLKFEILWVRSGKLCPFHWIHTCCSFYHSKKPGFHFLNCKMGMGTIWQNALCCWGDRGDSREYVAVGYELGWHHWNGLKVIGTQVSCVYLRLSSIVWICCRPFRKGKTENTKRFDPIFVQLSILKIQHEMEMTLCYANANLVLVSFTIFGDTLSCHCVVVLIGLHWSRQRL